MSNPDAISPAHMDFPSIWELSKGPNPQVLTDYLKWIADNSERMESATSHMQWYPPGFHGLLVGLVKNPGDPTHQASLQLNFYHEDYPGDEEPHAHARDAFSSWYAQPGTEQILTRYQAVPDKASHIRGLPVQKRELVVMNIGDRGDGQRPIYRPLHLGEGLILPRSSSNVAAMGSQSFSSTEVHHAGFRGDGVAISAHFKLSEEVDGLNTRDGFMSIKGLDAEAADRLIQERQALASEDSAIRLAPSTTLYPEFDDLPQILNRGTIPPPSIEVAERMILGGLVTATMLAK